MTATYAQSVLAEKMILWRDNGRSEATWSSMYSWGGLEKYTMQIWYRLVMGTLYSSMHSEYQPWKFITRGW